MNEMSLKKVTNYDGFVGGIGMKYKFYSWWSGLDAILGVLKNTGSRWKIAAV